MTIAKSAFLPLVLALIGPIAAGAEEELRHPVSGEKPKAVKVWTNDDLERLFGSDGKAWATESPQRPRPHSGTVDRGTAEGDERRLEGNERRLAQVQETVQQARQRVTELEEIVATERYVAMRRLRSRRVVTPSQDELDQARQALRSAVEELERLRDASD